MDANLAALLYLASGLLFIFALRGLSSPETSRNGNRAGMIGMAIAIVTTLFYQPPAGGFRSCSLSSKSASAAPSAYGGRRPSR